MTPLSFPTNLHPTQNLQTILSMASSDELKNYVGSPSSPYRLGRQTILLPESDEPISNGEPLPLGHFEIDISSFVDEPSNEDNGEGYDKVATPTNCDEVNSPTEEIKDEPQEFFVDPEEARRELDRLIRSQGAGTSRSRVVSARRRTKPAWK